ncbi:MAG TPA: TlpA family protein disulfide reductase [Calditrichaeota bacterium]|nr:TlpA family protein disulfide reductase [Calditrichota bacterium]
MRRALVSALFLCILFLSNCGRQDTGLVIKGRVLTEEGRPPLLAHVHLIKPGQTLRDPEKTLKLESDGSFEIIADSLHVFTLKITAVNHLPLSLPVYLDSMPREIKLKARLKHYDYLPGFDEVEITGNWTDSAESRIKTMIKQEDGRFICTVKPAKDTLTYALMNITKNGRSVNGTMSDAYRYDGGGDYFSLIEAQSDSLTVVFDPALLKRSRHKTPEVRYSDNVAYLQELLQMELMAEKEYENYREMAISHRKSGKPREEFRYNAISFKEYLLNTARTAPKPLNLYARFKLAQAGGFLFSLDSMEYEDIINTLPNENPLWDTDPRSFVMLYVKRYGYDKGIKKLEKNIPHIKSRILSGQVIGNIGVYYYYTGQKEKANKYYDLLTKQYSDIPAIQFYIKRINPDKKIDVGKPVPPFSIPLMDSDKTFSNKDLAGKYTLIDFWAVWCGPCIGEMPKLHEAYKKFKGPRFTILSLSFDGKEDDVRKFRKERWPMPWLHAFVKGGFNSDLAKKFEVMGIPKPILVDPDGTIVAKEADLRGSQLEETLKKYLK